MEPLAVITVKLKVWMDMPEIVMWIEIQVRAWAARCTGRALIIAHWDNCGPHETQAVKKSFERTGMKQEELMPKITDVLQ
ncbi:MAG: hypothetical protein SGPRY_000112, partial [Prymnesium sp.]